MKMEGNGLRSFLSAVIMSALVFSLVVVHTQVEAQEETCCRNTDGFICYYKCRAQGTAPFECGTLCNCICLNKKSVSDVGEAKGYITNCPTTEANGCYNRCRLIPEACARECGCSLTAIDCPTTEAGECFDICRAVDGPEVCTTKCACNLIPPVQTTNCPTTEATDCYNMCKLAPELCAKECACTLDIINCPTTEAKGCFDRCRAVPWLCAEICACTFTPGSAKGSNLAMVTA